MIFFLNFAPKSAYYNAILCYLYPFVFDNVTGQSPSSSICCNSFKYFICTAFVDASRNFGPSIISDNTNGNSFFPFSILNSITGLLLVLLHISPCVHMRMYVHMHTKIWRQNYKKKLTYTNVYATFGKIFIFAAIFYKFY